MNRKSAHLHLLRGKPGEGGPCFPTVWSPSFLYGASDRMEPWEHGQGQCFNIVDPFTLLLAPLRGCLWPSWHPLSFCPAWGWQVGCYDNCPPLWLPLIVCPAEVQSQESACPSLNRPATLSSVVSPALELFFLLLPLRHTFAPSITYYLQ